jgi:hypothetical protein
MDENNLYQQMSKFVKFSKICWKYKFEASNARLFPVWTLELISTGLSFHSLLFFSVLSDILFLTYWSVAHYKLATTTCFFKHVLDILNLTSTQLSTLMTTLRIHSHLFTFILLEATIANCQERVEKLWRRKSGKILTIICQKL